MFGLVYLFYISLIDNITFAGLLGAGVAVALLGFIDDHGHIAARWRLIAHFIIAIWLVYWLGGVSQVYIFGFTVNLEWGGHLLAVVSIVWLLNLYNFMDGIDGIAGIEALSTTLVSSILFFLVFDRPEISVLMLLMFSSVLGFLFWNFPHAKIFMGDVGSSFIGLIIGGLALCTIALEPVMLWVWLILLGVFIVDSTVTLLRRLIRGDKVYQAHRSHAYQHAALKYGSHPIVSVSVLLINLFWLAPWATVVSLGLIEGGFGLLAAYMPLIWLSYQ